MPNSALKSDKDDFLHIAIKYHSMDVIHAAFI